MRWVLLLATLGAAACVPALPPDATTYTTVRRLMSASPVPPPDDVPGWETATLPDFWPLDRRRLHRVGWYRLRVDLATSPTEPWGVWMPRAGQAAGVWINGALVDDGGAFADPLPRHWNRPHLVVLPPDLVRVGPNVVDVRVATHPGAPGYLRSLVLGPLRALRPSHEALTWWQVSMTQIVSAATFAAGILTYAVSIGRPELTGWGWFALGLVAWAWFGADAVVTRIPAPISTRVWEWSTAIAQLWAVVCMIIGFHRALALDRRRLERRIVLAAAAVSVTVLLVPSLYAFHGMLVAAASAVLLAGYLLALIWSGHPGSAGHPIDRRILLPLPIALAFALHDLAWVVTGRHLAGFLLAGLIPATVLATVAWIVIGLMVDRTREVSMLNRDLEHRVADKHAELERNYARMADLERARAIGEERERLMRDVHDGVGGQLVSTLAMVEDGTPPSTTVAEALRAALEDLRLVIDSLDPTEDDLLSVLATVRSRLEPRLLRHGLRFVWQVQDLPPLPGFGPDMALQVMRIVQEAVTNVVKHARARTVTVRTGEQTTAAGIEGVFVAVADDGSGIAPGAPMGRGLANMRRRAERLQGTLGVASTAQGTTITLWLPRESAVTRRA